MNTKRIVIVLGAGASKAVSQEFGIGTQLIDSIINQSKDPSGDTRPNYDNYIGRVFEELIANLKAVETQDPFKPDLTFENRYNFSNQLDAYKRNAGWKASIDSFLNLPEISNNPSFQFIARFLILLNIMGYEGACLGEAAFQRKSWLNELVSFISEQSILSNDTEIKLDIITFNYDRLVEEFLFRSFGNKVIPFTDSNIHHVYDKIGELPWQIKDKKSAINPINERIIYLGHPNFDNNRIFSNREKIRLITDQRQNEDVQKKCADLILNANTIVIMGFAFDPTNVSRIGLDKIDSSIQKAYAHLFVDPSSSDKSKIFNERRNDIPDLIRNKINYGCNSSIYFLRDNLSSAII